MSKSQTIQEFDENFFSSFAVPKVKDYSRLSSSPSRDQPCETSYFENHFPSLECDTPVKMQLPKTKRESDDDLPSPTIDNLLSSSSESTVINASQNDNTEEKQQQPIREPLKIVPNEDASASGSGGENQLIEGLEKLSMFAPKAPEERLSQRRRSEQRKKEEEDKRTSVIAPASGTRSRSISTKRSMSREPAAAAPRAPSVPRPPHNSVTRTISAPIANTGPGVITRAMAARVAENVTKTSVRRSVMPLKVAQKTPVAAVKSDAATAGGDRSRDRTRRTNTTASRRSVFPNKPAAAAANTTPIAPPRRSASANKATAPTSVSKLTPKIRPIATANRSSILRMNVVKPTVPAPAPADAQQNKAASRPAVPAGGAARNRQPLRVNPGTPSTTIKKPPVASSVQRQPPTRARSVDRSGQPPISASTPGKASRADLFNRLATPKVTATPTRTSHEGPASSIRKSAVRPVPSYVYSSYKGYEKKRWIY
ncbi:TPX2 domain-containing protein [Caenorhabditis elegans]|uniref:TPX2 domain-containing protein n=1 Tax=Caenorhabditis elegans TaxID=6239 RepID=Q8WSN6_CAEEL|nr:TPX2 domain-containing protein [Caenorhabditis elegans]ABA18185.1 TPX2-related alternative variant b [Caenorhabditis elegans]CCD69911.1 TPX2 domain-containing protein [Caenorhabditis elegans]|eukprot:NP_740806.1 TPX2 (Targeting Protein for Xenopus Klp2)-Like [Caenorhabditis elegans]